MEIHIVRDGERIVGVSATPEGAERIRNADVLSEVDVFPTLSGADLERARRMIRDGMVVEKHKVQDASTDEGAMLDFGVA